MCIGRHAFVLGGEINIGGIVWFAMVGCGKFSCMFTLFIMSKTQSYNGLHLTSNIVIRCRRQMAVSEILEIGRPTLTSRHSPSAGIVSHAQTNGHAAKPSKKRKSEAQAGASGQASPKKPKVATEKVQNHKTKGSAESAELPPSRTLEVSHA